MRIMVVFTGGTIGSFEREGDVISPGGEGYNRQLLARYADSGMALPGVDFDTMEPLTTLSENMTVDEWNRLITALRELDLTAYAGVIVTHGTDTLAYTAALLSLLWQGMPKPLWLVSAGKTLSQPDSNGLPNFAQAVEGIAAGVPGVWVAWKTSQGEQRMIPGYALRQCDLYTDEMSGYEGAALPSQPDIPRLYTLARPLKPAVLCIRPYPGIDYAAFQPGPAVKAVLHETYHAGTAPTQGNSTILSFATRCREQGIAVYTAPLKPDMPVYQSEAEMARAGIRPLPGVTFEMAYARLVVAYSQGDAAAGEALLSDFAQ